MERQKEISFWDTWIDLYLYPDDIVIRRPNSGFFGRSQDRERIRSYFEASVNSLNVATIAKQAEKKTETAS